MFTGLTNALRGIGGEFELIRTAGAFGLFSYVVGALAFQAWALGHGDHFDIIAFCAAFPAGLAVAYGSIAGAAAIKDRNAATAKIISETGAVPVAPPAGPPVPTEPPMPPPV